MRKYRIKVKMIKEVTMDHEQENMDKALKDVKTVVENATKDSLNQIFNSEPMLFLDIFIKLFIEGREYKWQEEKVRRQ